MTRLVSWLSKVSAIKTQKQVKNKFLMDLNDKQQASSASLNGCDCSAKTCSLAAKLNRVLSRTKEANCCLSKTDQNNNDNQINYNKPTSKFKAKNEIVAKLSIQYKQPEVAKQDEEDEDIDGGYAWIVLAVIFVISASTFGAARTYSLIFEKSARQDDATSRSEAALPFTIMGSVENMAGPLASYLLARSAGSWRPTVFLGCSLITIAHFIAAFQASILGKILTMGVMCGIGLSLVSISFFQINNSYFVKYRSRAFGLGLSGAVFGTWYITPVCQFVLDDYGTSACYLTLSIILLPNAALALLLKPKPRQRQPLREGEQDSLTKRNRELQQQQQEQSTIATNQIPTVAEVISINQRQQHGLTTGWRGVKLAILNPMFHLIWPTQLLFCWYNFVIAMIVVDFGKDRGLDTRQASLLVQIWAIGQLCGRILLGSLTDIKLISCELLTVICFLSIGGSASILNGIDGELSGDMIFGCIPFPGQEVVIPVLVFMLSMFISNLYLLFNDLVVEHMKDTPSSLSVGVSSFTGSFFLLPRAAIIGYYRDTIGNYDAMLVMFSTVSYVAASVWFLVTLAKSKIGLRVRRRLREFFDRRRSKPHLTNIVVDS